MSAAFWVGSAKSSVFSPPVDSCLPPLSTILILTAPASSIVSVEVSSAAFISKESLAGFILVSSSFIAATASEIFLKVFAFSGSLLFVAVPSQSFSSLIPCRTLTWAITLLKASAFSFWLVLLALIAASLADTAPS